MDEFDEWRRMLASQDGLATRKQILQRGLTDEVIEAHIAAGRWTPLGGGVHATFTGTLTPAARRRAAVLAYWPCALSHDTAGRIHGFVDGEDDDGTTHVTRPYGVSAAGMEGVEVHRSRAFDHIVAAGTNPPLVAREHTAVDLAVGAENARAGMRTLLRCLTVTSLTPAAVRVALEVRRPRRYRTALLDAVRYAEEGVTSALETLWVVAVEQPHGLSPAARQETALVDGRGRAEDLFYRGPRGEVVVRLDGRRYHAEESVTVLDRRRANAAELRGHRQLAYGWRELKEMPCQAAREVAALSGCDYVACERCTVL